MGQSAVAVVSFSLIVCRGRSLVARVWLIWVDRCGPIVPFLSYLFTVGRSLYACNYRSVAMMCASKRKQTFEDLRYFGMVASIRPSNRTKPDQGNL